MKTKNCQQCNIGFERRYKESYVQFDIRRFCSTKCRIKDRVGKSLNGWIGKKHTLESIEKMRVSHKNGFSSGKRVVWNKNTKGVMEAWNKGKTLTLEQKINNVRENHWNWQGGITPMNEIIRHSVEYKLWRESVFIRDNFTCQDCFQYGGYLNADHIKSFAEYPELRFAIDNGRTLCVECHKKTPNYGGKVKKGKTYA